MTAVSARFARQCHLARLAAAAGISLSALAWPALAHAQVAEEETASDADTGGDIIVTGSRIGRKDADSVGPILTLTSEDISRSGSSSIGDLLQKLPSAGVSLNSNGTQGTSYGASSINLRYLGGAEGSGNRVLVLVDGHRWVDGVGQRGFRDFVDLNTMPQGMIDGIEVLKDGASAIYGADAIAGVVNIKTVQPFDGLRGSVRAGITSYGDGAETSAMLTGGKTWDRASLILSASYAKSNAIRTDARDLTRLTLVPQTSVGTNPNGLFILPGLAGNGYFGTAAGFGNSSNPIILNNGASIGAGNLADNAFHVGALPGDFYNTQAQGIYSAGPSERYGFYGRFDYELTDDVTIKLEGVYNRRKSSQLFSPVLLDIGGTAGTVRGFSIPNSHAFNPFGTANGVPGANALGFGANSAWRIRKVMGDVGNRNNSQDVETIRFSVGVDGTFQIGGGEWRWDVFGSYSKNSIHTMAENGINYDNLFLGLGSPAICAATAGCVPINLFGPMTEQQAAYIRYTTREYNRTELYNAAFNVTGNLFELPAGPVALAVGYEYRQNRGFDAPDAFVNSASQFLAAQYTTTTSQTRTATVGSYDLHEAYAELNVPLLRDQPFAESLELSLAGRYSDYSTVGNKATLKAGLGYRPINDILIRGTYSQGFRAPSILELYQGARQTSFQGNDPCNGGASANPNLPGCAGVPTGYNQANYNLNGLIPGVISGNNNLKPETADTFSAGVSITPSAVRGLSLTVDYYKIKIKDAIASQTPTQIMQLCAVRGGIFCDLVSRDSGTGEILELLQGAQNLNSIETDGVDATLRYEFGTGIGRFAAVVDASYLNSFKTTAPNPAGGDPIVDERAGRGDTPRATYPRWKGQASLRWTGETADATLRGRYIGPTTDAVNAVKDARTDSIIYTDVEIGFNINDGAARFSIGVNNLFDKAPPASYANAPINYDIYTYDARGRFLYASFSVKM
ncbi:TonB-dependent receptor [Sphingopyxis witflariensis]|uniref:TonB-dependent receptor n=1 Tax=Sphingopyxis witflariensis TaxID=173675 RepID=A0A246K760_9SPHN|nr:TonB-dependent receptor [Sphingopyxis witflariensis]OWR01174.1 TonB-dependent receptor [Sphingopyxis witflariensis]